MWVRKRIDIRWSDILAGLAKCMLPGSRSRALTNLEELWSGEGETFACLSVRSGFDLLFQCLDLPPDSEVVLSSVTIPDMPRIVKKHNLQTVAIDLDMTTMSPDLAALKNAVNERTKVIVVAHLFGGKIDLTELAAFARERNIILVEDCAQAFVGLDDTGHPNAHISMFSFGPIKTNTSLGGGIFCVRDPALLQSLKQAQQEWPVQSRSSFARRLLKYAFVQVLCLRWIAGSVATACRWFGKDHDSIATSMARGFAGPDFFKRIRKQPSTPLLYLLHRRLKKFDTRTIDERIERGELLRSIFGADIPSLGEDSSNSSYWVFPIVVDEPERLTRRLWKAGFDATWHSSLTIVDEDDSESPHSNASRLLAQTVFLPFSRKMPITTLRRMAELVLEHNPRTHVEWSPLTQDQLDEKLSSHSPTGRAPSFQTSDRVTMSD